jgi:ArsR family transcriptional regulator
MDSVSRLFKTLGDETRLRIVNLLSGGELCVCDLTHALKMPQSTVSRHLATLKSAGLVIGRNKGTWAYYRLAEDAPPLAREVLHSLKMHLNQFDTARGDLAALELFGQGPDRNCAQPSKRGRRSHER